MSWTATWKATVTLCAMCAVGLWGCGGGGGSDGGGGGEYRKTIPDGYTEIAFIAGGETGSAISHDLVALPNSGLFKDASGTGTGTGGGGPTSIYDYAQVTCAFDYESTTDVEAIQITNIQANCINDNECIVCTKTGNNTNACSLVCEGVVPSSTAVAADTFGVTLTFTSTIVTDMPDPYGTIRYDASRTGTGFDLTTVNPDWSGCTYNPSDYELGTETITQGTWFANTADAWRKGHRVTNLDPNAGNSDRSNCLSTFAITALPTLSGADTPGTTVTNNLGTVTFKSKICDYVDDSEVSHNTSVCTPP